MVLHSRTWGYVSLVLLLLLLMIQLVFAQSTERQTKTILETVSDIPSLSKFAAALKQPYNANLSYVLNSSNASLTLFAPNDAAWLEEYNQINELLKRSGYPDIPKLREEYLNRTGAARNATSTNATLFYSSHFSILAGVVLGASNNASETGVADQYLNVSRSANDTMLTIPPGLNISDILWRYASALFAYHVVEGNHSAFVAHQTLPTLLKNDTEMVSLNGEPQIMHIENLTAAANERPNATGNATSGMVGLTSRMNSVLQQLFPLYFLQNVSRNNTYKEEITPIKILFGPAGDPLSATTIDELMRNETHRSGEANYIASVITPNISCSNGLIHIVNKVINIPLNASSVFTLGNYTLAKHAFNMCKEVFDVEAESNITIFAPSDAAFNTFFQKVKQSGITPDKLNKTQICRLLSAHVANGSITSMSLQSGSNVTYSTLDPDAPISVFGANSSALLQVNGTSVQKQNILLRNGVLHILPVVLEPEGFNLTSNNISGAIPPGVGSHREKVVGALSGKNGYIPPIFPILPQSTINATELGCPEDNGVCTVFDQEALRCSLMRDQLSGEELNNCSQQNSQYGFNVSSKEFRPIPMKAQCFNMTTHTCVNNNFLCPLTAPFLCGLQCYSKANYTCYASYSLCPSEASRRCGSDCYKESEYSCENGKLVPSSTSGGSGNETSPTSGP